MKLLSDQYQQNYGFLTVELLDSLSKEAPTTKVIVTTNMGRFITCADQAKHFIDIIEREYTQAKDRSKSDYVRDVSIYYE